MQTTFSARKPKMEILKASEPNLKTCLQTLEWFYQKSGLKINFSKTKVIKIGPIRKTDRRFCRENNLDWVSQFNALGIEYDVNNMEDITITNIDLKLDSLKKIIQNWTHRNISPIGRVYLSHKLPMSYKPCLALQRNSLRN